MAFRRANDVDTTHPSLLMRLRDRRDAAAWREFDALYRPMLFRFARASGLDDSQAEEVAQQCVVAVVEHIGEFDYDPARGRFKGWLRTLVSNRIRDLYRRGPGVGLSQAAEAAADVTAPDDAFERIWMSEHLRYCLDRVREEVEPATMRAFERYVVQDGDAEEVCRELNLTPQQLYRIRWRILQKLNERMTALTAEAE